MLIQHTVRIYTRCVHVVEDQCQIYPVYLNSEFTLLSVVSLTFAVKGRSDEKTGHSCVLYLGLFQENAKILFYPLLPDIRSSTTSFEGSPSSPACAFDKVIIKVKWACSTGEMILTRENRNTRIEACISVTTSPLACPGIEPGSSRWEACD
jgi:hypothetical protein